MQFITSQKWFQPDTQVGIGDSAGMIPVTPAGSLHARELAARSASSPSRSLSTCKDLCPGPYGAAERGDVSKTKIFPSDAAEEMKNYMPPLYALQMQFAVVILLIAKRVQVFNHRHFKQPS